MPVESGQHVLHYRLIEKIGEGGMGVVWKAEDTKLQRHVALKLLPQAVADDPDRRARFEREALAVAGLNHPNIVTLHSVEEADTPAGPLHFITLELVAGEPLARRLSRGPLPVSEALGLARHVAAALAAAHDRGIVHRDLKPDNVMVTGDGSVKLLDFGLATHLAAGPTPGGSQAETVYGTATTAGTILGTVGYMSPEQARGEHADRPADLWALGCLLYEMLTGRRAFPGGSVAESLAAILEREPDWAALPGDTPAPVRGLLERCLRKDPGARLDDARVAARTIDDALTGASASTGPRAGTRTWVAVTVVVAVAVVAVAVVVALRDRGGSEESWRPPRLKQITFASGVERFPAWSPDGGRIAYCRERGGIRKLFVRDLADGSERQVTHGTADDIQPSWHPDGDALLFVRAREPDHKLQPGDVFGAYTGGDVWRLDLTTNEETRLAENANDPVYSPDGSRIAVDAPWLASHRIWLLDDEGRNPVQLTTAGSEASDHVRPRWSFDGRWIVYQSINRTSFDVALVDVESGAVHALTEDYFPDYHPTFSPDATFVYFSSYRSGGINLWRLPLDADGRPAGIPQQVTTGAGQDVDLSVAADGRLAFAILTQNADIWNLPVDANGRAVGEPYEVVATTREDSRGAWSPDGRLLAFNSDRTGDMNIWVHDPADDSARQLTEGPGGDYQPTWSPDGRTLTFFSSRTGNADVWTVDVDSGDMRQMTDDPAYDVNPIYSPDGSRIAFQSDRGGRLEVWVMGADGSEQTVLTRDGTSGHFLRWTDDGSAVVFRCICGGQARTMLAPLDGGEPRALGPMRGGAHISLSPDRTRAIDVIGHQVLWVSPLDGGEPEVVLRFDDPGVRIDYPNWSPDGSGVLFDRFRPEGGDVWATEISSPSSR